MQRLFYALPAIGKRFRKINAFWVGPSAEEAWRQGARLTIGLSSPREYDLVEPNIERHPAD